MNNEQIIETLTREIKELEHKLKEAADEIDVMENEINVMVKNNDMMEEIIEKLKKKKECDITEGELIEEE